MRRYALAALICLTACKKDEKKDEKKEAPAASPAEAQAAIGGFKALAQEKKAEAAALGVSPSSGTMSGIGSRLGSLFGGGGGADSAAPSAGAAPSGSAAMPDIQFPPPAATGGDCNAVADRLMLVIRAYMDAELGKLGADERKMAEGMMGQVVGELRGQIVGMCTSEGWSQAMRDCALTAASVAEFEKCDQLAPSTGAATAEAPPAPAAAAAPAWTGGNSCADVGARMKQLTFAQVGELPAEMRAELDKQLDDSMKQMVDACAQGNWNAEVRTCMVQTTSIETIGDCFTKMSF